jgi:hypothetical protein
MSVAHRSRRRVIGFCADRPVLKIDDHYSSHRSPSEAAVDPELKHHRRIELAVFQRPLGRQLELGLPVDASADLHGDAGRNVEPITSADGHRRALKHILLPVQPSNPGEPRHPVRPERARILR